MFVNAGVIVEPRIGKAFPKMTPESMIDAHVIYVVQLMVAMGVMSSLLAGNIMLDVLGFASFVGNNVVGMMP